MKTLAGQMIRTAALSRAFMEKDSRRDVVRFVRSLQNPDGGFRGRGAASDLYYTVLAVSGLRALGAPFSLWKLWRYVRLFGFGENLDLVHLGCLVRLRAVFPMRGKTRRRFADALEEHQTESAYDLFVKLLAEDHLTESDFPTEPLFIPLDDPTTNLAAAVVVNRQIDPETKASLLARVCPSGGFSATRHMPSADLLSTATALFALRFLGADLDTIRRPCLAYIESLWRDSGGFAGHEADQFEDVEYTFYALLGIGCLME